MGMGKEGRGGISQKGGNRMFYQDLLSPLVECDERSHGVVTYRPEAKSAIGLGGAGGRVMV